MNAAFVEYGTLTESAVSQAAVSSQSVFGMAFPSVEVVSESPTSGAYAWVEGRVHAAPQQLFAHLRDYLSSDLCEQPKGYFKDVEIEEGGVGAGTIFHATIALQGIILNRLVTVSEPERLTLVETDLYTGMRTIYTVRERLTETWLRITTEVPDETVSATLPSAALVRRINVAELLMAQRAFA